MGKAAIKVMTRPIQMKHLPICSHCGRSTISVNVSTGTCWECAFVRPRSRSSGGYSAGASRNQGAAHSPVLALAGAVNARHAP